MVIEQRLRKETRIMDNQFCFMFERSIRKAIYFDVLWSDIRWIKTTWTWFTLIGRRRMIECLERFCGKS